MVLAPIWLMVAIGVLGTAVLILRDPRVRGAAAPLIVALSTCLSVGVAPVLLASVYAGDASTEDTPWSTAHTLLLAIYLLTIVATAIGSLLGLAYGYQRKRFSDVQLASAAFWLLNAFAVMGMVAAKHAKLSDWLATIGALLAWTFTIALIRGSWRRRLIRRNPPAGRRPARPAGVQAGGPIGDVHRSVPVVLAVRSPGPQLIAGRGSRRREHRAR